MSSYDESHKIIGPIITKLLKEYIGQPDNEITKHSIRSSIRYELSCLGISIDIKDIEVTKDKYHDNSYCVKLHHKIEEETIADKTLTKEDMITIQPMTAPSGILLPGVSINTLKLSSHVNSGDVCTMSDGYPLYSNWTAVSAVYRVGDTGITINFGGEDAISFTQKEVKQFLLSLREKFDNEKEVEMRTRFQNLDV